MDGNIQTGLIMKYIFRITLIVFLLITIFTLPLFIGYGSAVFNYAIYGIRIALMFFVCANLLALFKRIFYDRSIKDSAKSLSFSLITVIILFIMLEMIFMFVPRTHFAGFTRAAGIWHTYYWNPINSYGFRDKEPVEGDSTILFVGDSFTTGYGIKNINNRFSNIIDQKLNNYNSINIGVNGVDTYREYYIMTEFIENSKIKPSKIILQYYGNDIRTSAVRHNLDYDIVEYFGRDIPRISEIMIQSSFIVNYLYWSFPRYDTDSYINFFYEAYNDSLILSEHFNDLQRFVDYSNEHGIELIVIVFPFLQALDMSKELYIDNITSFFHDNNVHTINVATLLKDIEPGERVVNRYDAHASRLVNQIVAEEIIKLLDGY